MSSRPWKGEPDHETGEFAGYEYTLRRNPHTGVWLGYVDVPYGHPWYGNDYDAPPVCDLRVHGGITYADNEALDWRVGFDCGHAFDLMPELMGSVEWDDMVRAAAGSEFEVSYKDIAFARGQCKRLCEQAALAAEAQA